MNGESLVYPRVISGAIVGIDPTDPKPLVIIFQYNPDSLSRTLQPQMGAEGGDKTEALRLKGAPVETIKVDIELDAADQLERDDRTARDMGLYPVLSALEMLIYPRAQRVITNTQLLALGTIEILPPVAPLTVFVWGPKRALPVKLTEFTITEEAYDLQAEPDPREGLARAAGASATATCRCRIPATRCSSRTRSRRRRWPGSAVREAWRTSAEEA